MELDKLLPIPVCSKLSLNYTWIFSDKILPLTFTYYLWYDTLINYVDRPFDLLYI